MLRREGWFLANQQGPASKGSLEREKRFMKQTLNRTALPFTLKAATRAEAADATRGIASPLWNRDCWRRNLPEGLKMLRLDYALECPA